jgi:hypothetical protein
MESREIIKQRAVCLIIAVSFNRDIDVPLTKSFGKGIGGKTFSKSFPPMKYVIL